MEVARRTERPRSGYCTDCTSIYQARMVFERRCLAPGVTFFIDADGGEEGVSPDARLPPRPSKPARSRSEFDASEGMRALLKAFGGHVKDIG